MLLSLKEEEERCAVKRHNDKCTMTERKLSENLTGHLANVSRHSISWTKVLAQSRNSVRKILWRTERHLDRIISVFFSDVSTDSTRPHFIHLRSTLDNLSTWQRRWVKLCLSYCFFSLALQPPFTVVFSLYKFYKSTLEWNIVWLLAWKSVDRGIKDEKKTGYEIHSPRGIRKCDPCIQEAVHQAIKTTWSLAFPLVLAFCWVNCEGKRNKMRRSRQVTS
jgi:hypothetical protein